MVIRHTVTFTKDEVSEILTNHACSILCIDTSKRYCGSEVEFRSEDGLAVHFDDVVVDVIPN